jgi:hyperosmotically inducible periplasmic protein
MKSKNKILTMVPAMVLGIGLAIPAFAQNTSASAPVSAGTSMDQAGTDTEGAAKNAYTGTATALSDTTITTKVKTAFASGKGIKSNDIHVVTTAGVVTLSGQVQNSRTVARVVAIARNTKGVRGVNNDLQVSPSSSLN